VDVPLQIGMMSIARSDDDETTETEPQFSIQGQGGTGCIEERQDDVGACAANDLTTGLKI